MFTFPIPTYNITHDFPWDSENADRLFEMTARYGLPYFQNFLNSDMQPNQVRSMCCRLQLYVRELLKRGGGLFGSAAATGTLSALAGHFEKKDAGGAAGSGFCRKWAWTRKAAIATPMSFRVANANASPLPAR